MLRTCVVVRAQLAVDEGTWHGLLSLIQFLGSSGNLYLAPRLVAADRILYDAERLFARNLKRNINWMGKRNDSTDALDLGASCLTGRPDGLDGFHWDGCRN